MNIPILFDTDIGIGTVAAQPIAIPAGLVHTLQLKFRASTTPFLLASAWIAKLELWNPADVDFVNQRPFFATLTTAFPGANNNLLFTSKVFAAGGDGISVQFVNPGLVSQSLSVSVTGNAITVNLGTDGGGVLNSTAAQVITAIAASSPANALVGVANIAGSSGAGLVQAMAVTNLGGASDPLIAIINFTADTANTQYVNTTNFNLGVMGTCKLATLAGRIVWSQSGGAQTYGAFFLVSYGGVLTPQGEDTNFNGIVDVAEAALTVPFSGIQSLPDNIAALASNPAMPGAMGAYIGDLQVNDIFGVLTVEQKTTLVGIAYSFGTAPTGSNVSLQLLDESNTLIATFTLTATTLRARVTPVSGGVINLNSGHVYHWNLAAIGSTLPGSILQIAPILSPTI